MAESIPFDVQLELASPAQSALYLPHGTRTLRLSVTNHTDQPRKLWLQPVRTPGDYPTHLIHGHGDEDDDLWIHWAGGDEIGACVKTREKSPLEDRSLKFWEVIPEEVEAGETRPVFVNVSHHAGDVRPRSLTLRAVTEEEGQVRALEKSALKIHLEVPSVAGTPVQDPVCGVWDETGAHLHFEGSQLPDYVSRWWPPPAFEYRAAGELPGRLGLHLKDNMLTFTLDANSDGTGGVTLAQVKDHDWEAGQDVARMRPTIPELFRFCDDPRRGRSYYVARLWFLWFDKRLGKRHEVPDAERIEIVFDPERGSVPYMGTDFHYKETWGPLRSREKMGKAELGLGPSDLDDLAVQALVGFLSSTKTANPAQRVAQGLCGFGTRQRGVQAHVPLLTNVNVLDRTTSGDVRDG